jgi:cyanophycinase
MNILGKLIIIGGAVDKGVLEPILIKLLKQFKLFETGILKRILNESKHKEQSRIEVVTMLHHPKRNSPVCKGI